MNAGLAILSIREWIDKPYNKPGQQEIMQLTKVGIQKCDLKIIDDAGSALITIFNVDGKRLSGEHYIGKIIKNDGLSVQDFLDWFPKPVIDGCILHFTDLRY